MENLRLFIGRCYVFVLSIDSVGFREDNRYGGDVIFGFEEFTV